MDEAGARNVTVQVRNRYWQNGQQEMRSNDEAQKNSLNFSGWEKVLVLLELPEEHSNLPNRKRGH